MEKLELIDEFFEIEFEYCSYTDDFKVMSSLIRWCDSYTRHRILNFNILKDCTNYGIYLERDMQLPEYIKKIRVYIRKPKHRLEWEDKKIKEFKDWICKKFKKANPKIRDIKLKNISP